MGKLELSEEERLRRSERMRQLHAEGKAGGQYGKLGGRPRKKRASEIAAEEIEKKGKELFDHLWDLVENGKEKTKLDAIKTAYALEEQERKVIVEEEVRYDQLKHTQLAELVIGNLFELVRGGEIDLSEVIDAEYVAEGEALAIGEGDGRLEEEAEEEGATN
jgi:hypothetical protein